MWQHLLSLALILFAATVLSAQSTTGREDSVVVSAGISHEQLALEAKLNEVLKQGTAAMAKGEAAVATVYFESARAMVAESKLLADQEDKILRNLGNSYLKCQRAADAERVFARQLQIHAADCEPNSKSPASCADVQEFLARAKMDQGDFLLATKILRDAEANYGRAATPNDGEEFRMIMQKEQAQARLLLAAALFRTGDKESSIQLTEAAIDQLKKVEQNTRIQKSIRVDARGSLASGLQQLTLLRRF